jgi:putative serine protease PepD
MPEQMTESHGDQVHRYADEEPTSTLPFFAGPDHPQHNRTSRRSGPTAAIVAAALVVGVVGGVVGAVGYDQVNGTSSSSGSTTQPPLQTSNDGSSSSSSGLTQQGSPESVAHKVLPSVVMITGTEPNGGGGSGSGIILSSNGEILTNNHVAALGENGGKLIVSFNNGKAARARILGTDPVSDLAVLQAENVTGLKPATLGNSDKLQVGDNVVAVGSPFGLEATVTSGIVSALNRPVSITAESRGTASTTYPAIQTDAAINPGNSGGPLVNMAGQVVGIDSSIQSTGTSLGSEPGSIGLGFAIPISNALPIVQELRNGQTPTHARIGVTVSNSTAHDGLITGAGIQSVVPGSPAASAGIRKGDVVTRVNNHAITGYQSMVATIRGYRPGDTVHLTVLRNGQTLHLTATLESDVGSQAS